MSFGGFGGGFGSNNNQQQSSGFGGGFGTSTPTPSTGTLNLDRDKALLHSLTEKRAGFGSNPSGGFGATSNTGGGMFGQTTPTPSGFGSTTGKSCSSKTVRLGSREVHMPRSLFFF